MRPAQQLSPGKTSVCLVEHNPLAARHLERLLAGDSSLCLLSQRELVQDHSSARTAAEVFVLDSGTLPASLNTYLRSLRLRFPDARILVLDHPLPTHELCRLLFLGIQGFLSYEEADDWLPQAIRAVAAGHLWVPHEVLEQYVRYSTQLARLRGRKGDTFTRREKRILELVHRRLSNKEIGSILGISESTVKFHLGNIFAKLGVHDRQAIVEVVSSRALRVLLPQRSH